MKKIITLAFLSLISLSCSVDELDQETYGALEMNATSECSEFLGSDNFTGELTVRDKAGVTDIKGWTVEDLEEYLFSNLLESDVPRDGSFNPSLESIYNKFNNGSVPQGLFITTYSASLNGCTDSVKIGATVDGKPCTEFLGPDNLSGILTVKNTGGVIDIKGWTLEDLEEYLFSNLLANDVPRNGSFDPSLERIYAEFNDGTVPQGLFTTTYTASLNGCPDSVKIGATIDGGASDDCTEFLGPDNLSGVLTVRDKAGVTDIKGWTMEDLKEYLFSTLLASDVPTNGSFNPSLQSIYDRLNDGTVPQGLYTTTYTASLNGCTDSVKIGATIDGVPPVEDPACPEFLGPDNLSGVLTVRNKAGVTDIKGWTMEDLENYLFSNLLASDVPTDGSFNPSLQSIYDRLNDGTVPQGLYTTTYTASVDGCTDSVKIGATIDGEAPDDDPACTEFLGPDNLSGILTVRNKAGVTDIKGWTMEDLENYLFSNLLASDVPTDGSFNPSLQSIYDRLNDGTVPQGLYTTTYTANVDGCTDSVKIGATID